MAKPFEDLNSKIWWNLLLITVGTLIYTVGIQGIVVHHGFVPGGVFGLSLLLTYVNPFMSPGILYLLLNVPLFLLGWIHVSRRFFFYSLYAMVLTAVAFELIHLDLGIQEQIYAAIAAGAVGGFGVGIVLRSLGSNGGLDIVAIILNQKFNIGIGKTYFFFNLFLYGTGAAFLAIDTIVASLILIFATSAVLEYTLALFNQRKMLFIISEHSTDIAKQMLTQLKMSATFIQGRGAYSGTEKNIIMSITNNIMLKRVEELVFAHDPYAILIVENTFNVLGSSFNRRKLY